MDPTRGKTIRTETSILSRTTREVAMTTKQWEVTTVQSRPSRPAEARLFSIKDGLFLEGDLNPLLDDRNPTLTGVYKQKPVFVPYWILPYPWIRRGHATCNDEDWKAYDNSLVLYNWILVIKHIDQRTMFLSIYLLDKKRPLIVSFKVSRHSTTYFLAQPPVISLKHSTDDENATTTKIRSLKDPSQVLGSYWRPIYDITRPHRHKYERPAPPQNFKTITSL